MRPTLYVLLGVLLVPTVGLVGDIVTDGAFRSMKGTKAGPPLVVNSTDMVTNLNADYVDGIQGTDLYTRAEVDTLILTALETAGKRKFYVTDTEYYPDEALTACGTGYHMASMWEVHQTSGLRYAYDHPGAETLGDSGVGPPSAVGGWVRTGYNSDGYAPVDRSAIGTTNCYAWTSRSDSGTAAFIHRDWAEPTEGFFFLVHGSPWVAQAYPCSNDFPVWCVED